MRFVTPLYVLFFGTVLKEAVKHPNAFISTLGWGGRVPLQIHAPLLPICSFFPLPK